MLKEQKKKSLLFCGLWKKTKGKSTQGTKDNRMSDTRRASELKNLSLEQAFEKK